MRAKPRKPDEVDRLFEKMWGFSPGEWEDERKQVRALIAGRDRKAIEWTAKNWRHLPDDLNKIVQAYRKETRRK